MIVHRSVHHVDTPGRGTTRIDHLLAEAVRASGVRTGQCTVFVHHTSCSLLLNENADPDVRADLENFMARLVPDGDPRYAHDEEGPDDMAAHIRSVLTQSSLTVPVFEGRPELGTWQGLYLWEHRTSRHRRKLSFSCLGSPD